MKALLTSLSRGGITQMLYLSMAVFVNANSLAKVSYIQGLLEYLGREPRGLMINRYEVAGRSYKNLKGNTAYHSKPRGR
ncbi:hypothetical protein F5Y19DRAFT_422059 [Xylariaceae sp. FL1651]|nr:hypothetical protein F5Y19DRAFT_422059 [Xylariaceae sp. FL1651]